MFVLFSCSSLILFCLLQSVKYSPTTNSVIWMQCQLYFSQKAISYQFQTEYCKSLYPVPPLNQLRSSRPRAGFYFPIHAKCRIFLFPGQCLVKYTSPPPSLWSRIMLVQLISKWVIGSHGHKVYTQLGGNYHKLPGMFAKGFLGNQPEQK